MTAPGPFAAAPSARRPYDILGIIGVVVGAVGLLPSLAVLLIGLVPELNAIWWLGIVLLPILAVTGVAALVLGVIGIIVSARGRGRYALSIVSVVIGVVSVLPLALLWFTGAA